MSFDPETAFWQQHPTLDTVTTGLNAAAAVVAALYGGGVVVRALGSRTFLTSVGAGTMASGGAAATAIATHPEEAEEAIAVLEAAVARGAPAFEEATAAIEAAIARNGAGTVRVGQAAERAVRSAVDIGGEVKFFINGRGRIPDGITEEVLTEIKNVRLLGYTQQLRDYHEYADMRGLRFDLWTRASTILTAPLRALCESGRINLRYIP